MKKILALLLALLFILPLLPGQAAGRKSPMLVLFSLKPGDVTDAIEGEGTWESGHPNIAAVTQEGIITAASEGYTLILLKDQKGNVTVRCEVTVGDKPVPEIIQRVISLALEDWEGAKGEAFPRYNLYTQWFNPSAKSGFGWCGAFIGYQGDEADAPMDPAYRQKSAPPLMDGAPFAVRQASQTKLFEGFQSRNRLSNIPRPGYYAVYGRRGSTPYTHVGLVTKVEAMGDGVYLLETVEGNLNSRIKRFRYLYDSLAQSKERNIRSVPEEMQTRADLFNYTYVKDFYLNTFGQTWY